MSGIFKAYDIRGLCPEELDASIAEKIGRALTVFLHARKIVVGRDMRIHSRAISDALVTGITEQGCDVLDLGLCSTPMSCHANGLLNADGSVMITASHNPKEWNGFKLCRAHAVPISSATGIGDIQSLVEQNQFPAAPVKGKVIPYDILPAYGSFLRRFAQMDRKIRIVTDFANAMGSREIAGIRELFDVIPLYEELDGTFPNHEANPLKPETMNALRRKVCETKAEFGAAFDGDADRCGFVDEKGNIIPMDLFTALIAQDILADGPATVLYDLRSSRAVRECIEQHGGKAVRSRVGHAFIKQQMREENAVFAGELSGHYYFRENFFAESQGLSVLKLANLICKTGKTASELAAPLRKYFSSGEINSAVPAAAPVMQEIQARYADGSISLLDGISVEYGNWRFNVRASNTEPLLRLIVEADTRPLMETRRDELLNIIRSAH